MPHFCENWYCLSRVNPTPSVYDGDGVATDAIFACPRNFFSTKRIKIKEKRKQKQTAVSNGNHLSVLNHLVYSVYCLSERHAWTPIVRLAIVQAGKSRWTDMEF